MKDFKKFTIEIIPRMRTLCKGMDKKLTNTHQQEEAKVSRTCIETS